MGLVQSHWPQLRPNKMSVLSSSALEPLIFSWDLPRRRNLAIAGFLVTLLNRAHCLFLHFPNCLPANHSAFATTSAAHLDHAGFRSRAHSLALGGGGRSRAGIAYSTSDRGKGVHPAKSGARSILRRKRTGFKGAAAAGCRSSSAQFATTGRSANGSSARGGAKNRRPCDHGHVFERNRESRSASTAFIEVYRFNERTAPGYPFSNRSKRSRRDSLFFPVEFIGRPGARWAGAKLSRALPFSGKIHEERPSFGLGNRGR